MAKNKISQTARREVRKYVRQQYLILNAVIKQRPRFIPLFLWAWGAKIFIDTKQLRDFMENGVMPKSQR